MQVNNDASMVKELVVVVGEYCGTQPKRPTTTKNINVSPYFNAYVNIQRRQPLDDETHIAVISCNTDHQWDQRNTSPNVIEPTLFSQSTAAAATAANCIVVITFIARNERIYLLKIIVGVNNQWFMKQRMAACISNGVRIVPRWIVWYQRRIDTSFSR